MPVHFPLLTPSLLLYAGVVTIMTFAGGLVYRYCWLHVRSDGVTPTGFGAFLAPAMLGAALISQAATELIVSLLVVAAVTAVYWLDDIINLSARVRIIVSFFAGVAIAIAYLPGHGFGWYLLIALIFSAGCVSIALTNMVNFYDGADLNLAVFISLTAIMILFFMPNYRDWSPIAFVALTFILPFGAMNSRPQTIYLGDSGSFAFAGLLTVMVVAFVQNIANLAPEVAIPAALPTLDVAYVFAIRIFEKHDILTRNYLHLYQRLSRRYKGFGYLLPQIGNVVLCLATVIILQAYGVGRIASVIATMILVTVPFYFICRWLFLAGPPEGPLYETSR